MNSSLSETSPSRKTRAAKRALGIVSLMAGGLVLANNATGGEVVNRMPDVIKDVVRPSELVDISLIESTQDGKITLSAAMNGGNSAPDAILEALAKQKVMPDTIVVSRVRAFEDDMQSTVTFTKLSSEELKKVKLDDQGRSYITMKLDQEGPIEGMLTFDAGQAKPEAMSAREEDGVYDALVIGEYAEIPTYQPIDGDAAWMTGVELQQEQGAQSAHAA